MRNLTADSTGLATWIDRESQTMHDLQVWRELVQNGIEAGATIISIDGWQDPETGQWFTRCTDNGTGMTPDQLIKHLSTLHVRKGSDSNYGIGARIASLPHNPAGVTFATRTADGNEQMVRLVRERGAYGIKEWELEDGTLDDVVVPTDGELSRLKGPSGTAVILHGDGKTGTWDESMAYQIHRFLTGRYFDFPPNVAIYVGNPSKKDTAGGQLQRVKPVGSVLDEVAVAKGEVPFADAAGLSGRIRWWQTPNDYNRKRQGRDQTRAGIGLVVDDEVFNVNRSYYGDFGILYKPIQDRVMLLIDVDGATMDTARASVVFPLGKGERRRNTPWKELGRSFADNLPDEIRALAAKVKINAEAMSEQAAKLLDAEWMSKLQPLKVSVPNGNGSEHGAGNGNGNGSGLGSGNSHHGASQGGNGPTKPRLGARREASGNKPSSTVERTVVPRVEFVADENFDTENHPARVTWHDNVNTVLVSESFAPYVRDVERWVKDSGHNREVVTQAVQLAYQTELAALIIDANGQDRHGASPEMIDQLKADASLYAKCLGMQSLSQRIEEFLKKVAA